MRHGQSKPLSQAFAHGEAAQEKPTPGPLGGQRQGTPDRAAMDSGRLGAQGWCQPAIYQQRRVGKGCRYGRHSPETRRCAGNRRRTTTTALIRAAGVSDNSGAGSTVARLAVQDDTERRYAHPLSAADPADACRANGRLRFGRDATLPRYSGNACCGARASA